MKSTGDAGSHLITSDKLAPVQAIEETLVSPQCCLNSAERRKTDLYTLASGISGFRVDETMSDHCHAACRRIDTQHHPC